jgi:DNA-binding transcriptional LysR family regulator
VISQTDMVAALSRRIAEPFAKFVGLSLFEPPLALSEARVGQVWHTRTSDDPGHVWLRKTIAEVCATL